MTVLRKLFPGLLGLTLALAALCIVAGSGDNRALADDRPPAWTDFERAPVSDDPGPQYGNAYYRNCLMRRESGSLRCGETRFWRECVRCRNICRMHCSCDDCPETEGPGGGGNAAGGEDTAAAPASVVAAEDRVVVIAYAEGSAPEPERGGICSLRPDIDYSLAGVDRSVMTQPVPGTRGAPAKEGKKGLTIGVDKPYDNYRDCAPYFQNQIRVNGTWLHENFGVTRNVSPGGKTLDEYLSAAGGRYVAGMAGTRPRWIFPVPSR